MISDFFGNVCYNTIRRDCTWERRDSYTTIIESEVTNMALTNEDLQGTKLHLENVTDRNISILAENYVPAAKRLHKDYDRICDGLFSVLLECGPFGS